MKYIENYRKKIEMILDMLDGIFSTNKVLTL